MHIADLPDSRKFMERVNTWFYKTKDRDSTTNVRDILKNFNTLTNYVQFNPVTDPNLCILFDISNLLIQQVTDSNSQNSPCNTISQSCTNINEVGKCFMKNEPLLLSASKYKSLDTLAGCFTSVEAAGFLNKSRNDSMSQQSNKENMPISPMAMDTRSSSVTNRKSLPAITLDNQSSQNDQWRLQRQLTWERDMNEIPVTSSPIGSIADGLGQISLDELDHSAIIKLCTDTRSNMDKIENLLKKSLNKTHNLSKSLFLNNSTEIGSVKKLASPVSRINRGTVGRFSLGAARLPVARRSVTSTKTPEVVNRNASGKENNISGATTVLQNASKNIMSAKRKISSLTSLKDYNSANNVKLKTSDKRNSLSNIPSLRTSSPRVALKK